MLENEFRFLDKNDSGFVTTWMIGFAFLIILIGALFFSFGTAIVQRQHLIQAADRASNAGATAIDEQELIASDGNNVFLNRDTVRGETAEERCNLVIVDERNKIGSEIIPIESGCVATNAEIEATVVGEVSWGGFASIMGVPKTKFTVKSRAQPSCSDGGC